MDAARIIRLTAPEFEMVVDEDLNDWIELTRPLVSRKQFGDLYEQALALRVCHAMKMAGMGSEDEAGGAFSSRVGISSISDGGTSISFGAAQGVNDPELGQTVYGVQYSSLAAQAIIPILCGC